MDLLTRFELRKIIRKKSFLAGIVILVVASIFITFVSVSSESLSDETGKDLTGLSAISLRKQYDHKLAGAMSTDKMAAVIERYHDMRKDPKNLNEKTKEITDEAYHKYQAKDDMILNLMRSAFSPLKEYNFYMIDSLSPEDASAFYAKRMNKVNEYLDMDYTYGNYSREDKAYYQNMNERIPTPFKLDYSKGWEILFWNSGGIMLAIVFIMCVCVSPLFAGEYQSGADSIILSSRYGRSKVIVAKLKASFLFTTGLFLFGILFYTLLTLGIYGFSGWDASLQTVHLTAPFPLTIFQTYLWTLLIGYLACLMMMSVTLLLSARMKSPFSVIIWSTVLLFVPMFIPYSKSSRLFNHLIQLLPNKMLNSFEALTHYELYHIFGQMIPQHMVMTVLALLVTILLLPFVYRGFRNHQVT